MYKIEKKRLSIVLFFKNSATASIYSGLINGVKEYTITSPHINSIYFLNVAHIVLMVDN